MTAQYLSTAIATRCNIEAVQHRTSLLVHMSQSSGPSDHPDFICNEQNYLSRRVLKRGRRASAPPLHVTLNEGEDNVAIVVLAQLLRAQWHVTIATLSLKSYRIGVYTWNEWPHERAIAISHRAVSKYKANTHQYKSSVRHTWLFLLLFLFVKIVYSLLVCNYKEKRKMWNVNNLNNNLIFMYRFNFIIFSSVTYHTFI